MRNPSIMLGPGDLTPGSWVSFLLQKYKYFLIMANLRGQIARIWHNNAFFGEMVAIEINPCFQ